MANDYFAVHPDITSHFEDILRETRPELIDRAVVDPQIRAHLKEISLKIDEIYKKDPSIVAAWGLACGGSCKKGGDMFDLPGMPIGRGDIGKLGGGGQGGI